MEHKNVLELCAVAAGMTGVEWNDWDGMEVRYGYPFSIWSNETGHFNSIYDSGHALWLAAKLGLSILPYPVYNEAGRHSVIVKQRRHSDTLRVTNPTETMALYDGDPLAATRLAITLCAAKIGQEILDNEQKN